MRKHCGAASLGALAATFLLGCGEKNAPPAETASGGKAPSASASAPAFGSPGTGVLRIGERQYDLDVQRCLSAFGALSGNAVSVAEPDNIYVSFEFSPPDWRKRARSEGWEEAGTITLRSENPYGQWESGVSATSGYNLRDIDPATLDISNLEMSAEGRSVRGDARFVDVNALMRGETDVGIGSFTFTCPEL